MSLAFRRLKVYVRLVLVLALLGAISLVLIRNRGHDVHVWFFGLTDVNEPVNVVWVMLSTAGIALISWWVLRFAWGLWRDLRSLAREDVQRAAKKDLEAREKQVADRERKMDAIVKQAVEDEPGNSETG